MATTLDTPFRLVGPTTREAFDREFVGTPIWPETSHVYDVVGSFGRLYVGHSKTENDHDRIGRILKPEHHNNLALRVRGYPEESGTVSAPTGPPFATFASYVDCARAWTRRLSDTNIPQPNYVSIGPFASVYRYAEVYNPRGDAHPITGVVNDPVVYATKLVAAANRLPEAPMPTDVVLGQVPKPAIKEEIVTKPMGAGWWDYGPRDLLLGLVYHNVLGNAAWTGTYFATYDTTKPNGGHGWNALTDWGVCNTNDGAALDGVIIQWNDPDGRRSPYASGGVGPRHGDGPAMYALCAQLRRDLNQATEAIEISRRRNGDPVSAKCLAAIIALSAWRADAKAKVRHDVWPKNNHGIQMTLTHSELGKPECDALDVVSEVIEGVRERLRFFQLKDEPVPAPLYVRPVPPVLREWDGKDRTLGPTLLRAIQREFAARQETKVYQYADRTKPQVRPPLEVGEKFWSLYWFESGGEPWVLTPTGARVPVKNCTPDLVFR